MEPTAAASATDTLETVSAEAQASSEKPKKGSHFRLTMMRAVKDKQYEQVFNEYDDMVLAGFPPDRLILNCLVEAKAQTQGTQAARETMDLLLSQHPTLEPDAQTYAALMNPCGKEGDKETAFALYDEALAKGIALHEDLFNQLIVVCTQAQDFDAAEGIFTMMREKGVKPKSATYLKYIYASFRLRRPDKAYDMLVNMENEWRVPDAREYQRMLGLFKWANHNEGQLRCLQGITEDFKVAGNLAGIDREIIGNLFKGAVETRRPEDVITLAQTLTSAGVQLDRFQLVGVALAHLRNGSPQQSFTTLAEYFDAGHALSERVEQAVTKALTAQADAVDEAYFLLEQRKQEGKSVPLPAVNLIIEACAELRDLDRAFATWAELDKLDLAPDVGTFNALLHTCVRTRELASVRRLLSRMQDQGVAPDAVTYSHQCAMHVMCRENDRATALLETAREAGIKPHGRMYVTLINSALTLNQVDQAKELVDAMEGDGHKVDAMRARIQTVESGGSWSPRHKRNNQRRG